MKILLVDDDHEDRQAFTEAMKKLNLPIEQLSYARDSNELFGHLENDPDFHLVLLDINMPLKNGKQCLREMKTNEKFKHIPVIIYTVSMSDLDIHESFENGAHYYVVKPYADSNFLLTLQTVFDIDWKVTQPVPSKEDFVINYTYTT
jgi:CheY-like chemotaxis protein